MQHKTRNKLKALALKTYGKEQAPLGPNRQKDRPSHNNKEKLDFFCQ